MKEKEKVPWSAPPFPALFTANAALNTPAPSVRRTLQGRGYKPSTLTDPSPTPAAAGALREAPHPTPTPTLPTDLIIASCRVSVVQKCEWRSDTARTKGRSTAPPGQADRLAADTQQ